MASRTLTATAGSLLAAVGSTADMVTNSISALGCTVDVLHYNAQSWREQARLNCVADTVDAEHRAKRRAALRRAELDTEIESRLADPSFRTRYDQALAQIEQAFVKA